MEHDTFYRAVKGIGLGVAAIAISGALSPDSKGEKKSRDIIVINASTIVGLCVVGCVYFDMPAMIPVIISSFARVTRESIKLYDWANNQFKKE